MKVSFLQVKRALNVALFVLLLSVAGTKNSFAQTQLATLQHGDDLSVFYGANAFVEAHTAAVGGDIITLSGGSFTPCTITKGITLRGAGCENDTVANTIPTIFGSDILLNVADNVNFLNVEGILFNCIVRFDKLNNPRFTKCYMNSWLYYGNTCRNAQFVNCFVKRFNNSYCSSTMLINSVVSQFENSHNYDCSAYNSIISFNMNCSIYNLNAFNCIVKSNNTSGSSSYHAYQSSFINCIGIKGNASSNYAFPFYNCYTSNCVTYNSWGAVFETFTGTFEYGASFVLKDEIATGFHGTDGTQAGIYGGFVPYDIRPAYMVLKRCNVANRTTIDGKLSVDIEVIAEED